MPKLKTHRNAPKRKTPKAKEAAKAKAPGGVAKRRGRPLKAKKVGKEEAQKLKKAVSKTKNESIENEVETKALDGKKSPANKKAAASPAKKKRK